MKKIITLIIFLLLMIASLFLISEVSVNYNLEDYLPKESEITKGINLYENEFGESSQATVSFDETSIAIALELKNEILQIEGINKVIFVDDYFNEITYYIIRNGISNDQQILLDNLLNGLLNQGLSYTEAFIAMLDYLPTEATDELYEIQASFLSEEEMLMHIVFANKQSNPITETALNEIKELLESDGYDYHFMGNAISFLFTKNTIESEVLLITLICIPLILFILLFMSRSYFDIIIFSIVVGVSVIINLGSNVILPNISFITQSMAIALQLAISLDYVIFMLSAYHQAKSEGNDTDKAINIAKKKTMKPIIASALTTAVSFLALIFMRFTIGIDIGIVFAKAIVISLISTIILLPILIKMFEKILDKTTKKRKNIFKGNISKKLYKYRYFFLGFLLVVLAGSIFMQTKTDFSYGASSFAGTEGSSYNEDLNHITDEFGNMNQVVIIANKDDQAELNIYNSLSNMESVSNLNCGIYYKSVITNPMILDLVTSSLYSDEYALIQFNLNSSVEGEEAFTYYEAINLSMEESGFDEYYILGDTAVAYNIKDTVEFDYKLVMVIALISIMIIILISFKNLLLPILLPLVIETSVLFTMALLSFINNEIVFLASLIVSAILLGVTIDYAILLGKGYTNERLNYSKEISIQKAIKGSSPSIITSALLFSVSGLTICMVSSIKTISQIGLIIAVGAITSLLFVLIILPQILLIFDKWICKSEVKIK